jgi:ABC-2 type transport system ATP-binding protein
MSSIHVDSLSKIYRVPVRETGLKASIRGLFNREFRDVHAASDITFDVEPGELVGFLGPNGAGKTTTLKMLSGLLYPTSGSAEVLGYEPFKREKAFLRQIALVMGNRNSLQWDLPVSDSLELRKALYQVPQADYELRRDAFVELLELGSLIDKPIRNLSLGERMKVELMAALLHRPKVLFLDEPTLGLDVSMQKRVREFIREYQQDSGTSILLTSHYMADISALCDRVIVIHQGRIIYDGGLDGLRERFSTHKTITVSSVDDLASLARFGEVIESGSGRAELRVVRAEVAGVASQILNEFSVTDLSVEDVPLEDVIEMAFEMDS